MEVKELRIGNCIQHIENKECVILSSISEFNFLQYFEGIPITEEWLINFGFIITSHYDNCWVKNLMQEKQFILNDKMIMMDIDLKVNIQYVHQLQNLYFALTQTELELCQ